jgi:ATP-dependent protease ClpP protease subunit
MTRRWYDFRAQARGTEIVLYDEIGAFGIPAKAFLDELKALGPLAELTVRINSPGGSVFDGVAIYNALKRHDAVITVWVDGIAASIASVIAMAGDEVVMPENAMLMLHDPAALVIGTAADMRAMAEALDKMKAGMAAAYRDKSGRSDAEIEARMAAETWLSAQEAVDLGFADRVEGPVRMAAHFDLSRFRNPPPQLAAILTSSTPQEDPMSDPQKTRPRKPDAVEATATGDAAPKASTDHFAPVEGDRPAEADEVQNVRAFGSENMLEGVQAVVNQRLAEMATKMDATLEHLRIGAIKGQILDADGTAVIYDLFTEFGVTAHTEIDFDLDNATPAPGVIKKKCHDIRRKIEDELGAQPYEHIHAICGADFFDDLITHSEVAKAYNRYLDGAFLRQGQARGSFEYSGIVFEEYRGRVGTVDFTDASKVYFFPVGVPGLFRQYNAPADFVETANTIGLPRYAKQAVDQQFARWVMLHVQSNPLPICTRPRVLIKGKRT